MRDYITTTCGYQLSRIGVSSGYDRNHRRVGSRFEYGSKMSTNAIASTYIRELTVGIAFVVHNGWKIFIYSYKR